MQPLEFMLRRRARLKLEESPAEPVPATAKRGRPAILHAPVPETGMRFAKKGERPPSKFAPGEDDGVIDRYDAYAQAFWSGRVKRYGR